MKHENFPWYLNDSKDDSIPGISLNKAHQFLDSFKIGKGANVVVAIIDTEIDIEHEDLKNKIWINPHEIPNNQIDDDKNGYIDDINGWNFLGNINGENVMYTLIVITCFLLIYLIISILCFLM